MNIINEEEVNMEIIKIYENGNVKLANYKPLTQYMILKMN